jgi:hypothetical protein
LRWHEKSPRETELGEIMRREHVEAAREVGDVGSKQDHSLHFQP